MSTFSNIFFVLSQMSERKKEWERKFTHQTLLLLPDGSWSHYTTLLANSPAFWMEISPVYEGGSAIWSQKVLKWMLEADQRGCCHQ